MPTEQEEVDAQLQRWRERAAVENARRKAAFLKQFDIKQWVHDNGLGIRSAEPPQPPAFDLPNFDTRSSLENPDRVMHASGQDAYMEHDYSIESSFFMSKIDLDENDPDVERNWTLAGIKIFAVSVNGPEGEVWHPHSYFNHRADGDPTNQLWINYPTSNESDCLDPVRDTRDVHFAAVERTRQYGRGIPVRIVVRPEKGKTVKYTVDFTARIVNSWKEDGEMYKIEILRN